MRPILLGLAIVVGSASLSAQTTVMSGAGSMTFAGTGTTAIVTPLPVTQLILLGDSKTFQGTIWAPPLVNGLLAAGGQWSATQNGGVSGSTVASIAASLPAVLNPMSPVRATEPVRLLMNWGANDVSALPAEALWEANYLSIIDAAVAKWPGARVYLARAWRQGFDADCDALAVRLTHLVAARPGVVQLGPDERIYIKGSDNGVSETVDGIHYSTLGHTLHAAAWQAVLWP